MPPSAAQLADVCRQTGYFALPVLLETCGSQTRDSDLIDAMKAILDSSTQEQRNTIVHQFLAKKLPDDPRVKALEAKPAVAVPKKRPAEEQEVKKPKAAPKAKKEEGVKKPRAKKGEEAKKAPKQQAVPSPAVNMDALQALVAMLAGAQATRTEPQQQTPQSTLSSSLNTAFLQRTDTKPFPG